MAELRVPIAVEDDSNETAAAEAEKTVAENTEAALVQAEKAAAEAKKTVDAASETELEAAEAAGDKEETEFKSRRERRETEKKQKKRKKEKEPKQPKEPKKPKAKKAPREPKEKGSGSKRFLIILLCLILLLSAFGFWIIYDNNRLEKSFYQVKSGKVLDNIRIVSLADLHLKEFGNDNERLVYEISKLGPDLIAIVGDMNMEHQPDNYDSILSLCKQLEEIAPLYYSLGNHEIDSMLFEGSNIYKDLKKAGIKIFNNETETVEIKGTAIDVIGLTQNPTEFEEYGKEFFDKAMEADDNFKLVLNHYPEQFLGVLDDYEIDLALAGHAHGGQVRLPWIGGLYAADQGILPELCDGYHEIGNSKLVISRGLGKSGWCPRINNTPEITVVDISWY